MSAPPARLARVVLVDGAGGGLGVLPAVAVATPWWQDIEPVVDAVRQAYGIGVVVLRLLSVGEPEAGVVEIAYLAETADPAPAIMGPWIMTLEEHALRLPYARPGGPAADLAWAETAMRAHGVAATGPARQVRTWNLSSLWRIPCSAGEVWLKAAPPFFAHEGALLEALRRDGAPVPRVLGAQPGRVLLEAAPGEDLYGAQPPILEEMTRLLVDLQVRWAARVAELLALGLPDWRSPTLDGAIADVAERNADSLTADERGRLDQLIDALPARWAAVKACGLPDSLVHGDFHPGNFRGDGSSLVLLDWGDSGVGCPLLDQSAFLDRIAPEHVPAVRQAWEGAWRTAIPGSDPARAGRLLAPVAAARQAVLYQGFLDRIEPSEHPYHRGDPAHWLRRAAALAAHA
jgi:Ser/Thr protein kinase RdoA (MazF antagonist)